MIELFPGTTEPQVRTWQDEELAAFAVSVLDRAAARHAISGRRGPVVIAVDGRSGAGKSTFAKRLATAAQGAGKSAVCLEADDVMWWEPMWQWAPVADRGIFGPLSAGEDIDFVPPQWGLRGRQGSIGVPVGTEVVIWEGVGASQLALARYLDYVIWVQSDCRTARRLGLARDTAAGVNGGTDEAEAFWDQWSESEQIFLETDRPWDRADRVVLGVTEEETPGPYVRVRAAG